MATKAGSRRYDLGGLAPSPSQVLLLRAALDREGQAARLWREWSARESLDDVDPDTFRLLPLVWRRLDGEHGDPPSAGRLRGIHRFSWIRYQMLVRHGAVALGAVAEAGVPVMLLNGAAVAARHHETPADRPADGLDVMVPQGLAARALGILHGRGWRSPAGLTLQEQLGLVAAQARNAVLLKRGEGAMNLHWRPLRLVPDVAPGCWAGADVIDWHGLGVRVMSPADQLFHIAVAGLDRTLASPVWVADAMQVMRQAGERIDWPALVERGRRSRCVVPLGHALAFLSERFAAPVPGHVLDDLERSPSSQFERMEFRVRAGGSGRAVGFAPVRLVLDASRFDNLTRFPAGAVRLRLRGVLPYLRARLRGRPWSAVPGMILKRARGITAAAPAGWRRS